MLPGADRDDARGVPRVQRRPEGRVAGKAQLPGKARAGLAGQNLIEAETA